MNRFITFEGIEGCGKTTQIHRAGDYLKQEGVNVVLTDEPGGTALGRRIREILLNRGPYTISAHAELLLFAAARAQHVRELIIPALNEGRWVLCDRFLDATLAYQGYGRGLDHETIKQLHGFSACSLLPALTLLFDLPVETGLCRALERIAGRNGVPREDRFEREGREFHQRVREGYLALAEREPHRYRVIDAARDREAVFHDVCTQLRSFMEA